MLKLLKKRSTLGRTLVWAALAALTLSFLGNLTQNFAEAKGTPPSIGQSVKIVLDTIPEAIKVFRAKPRAIAGSGTWVLTIAETLGALVTFAAILALLGTVLKEQLEKLRISFASGHSLLLGFDTQARLFLKSKQRPRDKTVVVVDPNASEKIRDKAHAEGCLHYATTEETELRNQMRACRIGKAERVIISTGTDAGNLELIKGLADADITYPKDVVVHISDVSLHQQLELNTDFMQSLGEQTSLRLFNYPKAAAVDLLSRTNFTELAVSQGQGRVSLLVFGATPEAAEIVTHYLRSSPSLLADKPQIVWVVEMQSQLSKMLSLNYPPLAKLIDDKDGNPPLAWAADIIVHETGEATAPYDEANLQRALAKAEIPTAVIIAEGALASPMSNIQIGNAIRQRAQRMPELQIPIFVFSQKKSAEDQFLKCRRHEDQAQPISQKKLIKTNDLAETLEPFGRSDEVCSWGALDTVREASAKQLHEQYLLDRAKEQDAETHRAASLKPWGQLSETFKNANRRAADQAAALNFSAQQLITNRADANQKHIEILASLEHDAWWIDRELDGWIYAEQRDNDKKMHPDLKPYDELSDEIQEYDRAKVRSLLS
ncbi:RyR domain-containing protein [Sulfitobacter donghicola]|uniref:RyR domain-containing protein n=1 Tax=Sulfitobacter donghicola TaxID=421000 RepID=UPI00068B6F67|nr:RyR domain-containing protein [Sulfitobacter donghicola]KIN69374.1 RyR domain protein [Sulfitobacter donghicola DSW-25 = KCTC 12864 = JCM 14565]